MAQSSNRPRVLVADGDDELLSRTALRLDRAGYEVLVASDGEVALARACAERPDVCVLDAMMPKLTGYDVTRRLRADPRTSRLAVLLLTALPQEATAFDAGADAYVRKPFTAQELTSHIGALLAPVTPAQKAPRRSKTAGSVFSRITRSSATDQRSR